MDTKDLYKQFKDMPDTPTMPVVFVGHGSPMNAIENNEFSTGWSDLQNCLPKPVAILCVSAHWETRGTFVTAMEYPKTIHDFYGFPDELYRQEYPARGDTGLVQAIKSKMPEYNIGSDFDWGLDHGSWCILKFIYPDADIPVIQMSIDYTKGMEYHYQLAQQMAWLRNKGVLIIGSGNIIHNLRLMQIGEEGFNAAYAFDWSARINDIIKQKIVNCDYDALMNYQNLDKNIALAVPTPEHYIPLLYTLGLNVYNSEIKLFNDKIIAGSLSMTSFLFE